MAQSLSNVLLHLVFSTKNRRPWIDAQIESEMHAYLASVCKSLGCPAQKVGGVEDHVHVLCLLSRTIEISDLLGKIKANSSRWIKTKGPGYSEFSWQNGYGAFSIGQSQLEAAKEYIANQREHHRGRSFQEEYRALLEKYRVEYDERYVWD